MLGGEPKLEGKVPDEAVAEGAARAGSLGAIIAGQLTVGEDCWRDKHGAAGDQLAEV